MADKIQKAYEVSKNIYDDMLTQGIICKPMYLIMHVSCSWRMEN